MYKFEQFVFNYANKRNKRYKPPEIIIVAGSVKTHAKTILVIVPFCKFFVPFEATMAPATPDDNTWVVETGKPDHDAKPIVPAAIISAVAPSAYVMWRLPIFSPMVTTIRFQPIIVPMPKAKETSKMHQIGA